MDLIAILLLCFIGLAILLYFVVSLIVYLVRVPRRLEEISFYLKKISENTNNFTKNT